MKPPPVLVSVDPATHGHAWALWVGGYLQRAGYVAGDGGGRTDAAVSAAAQLGALMPRGADVVVEFPQVYPTAQQKGDANDLLAVAFAAGCTVQVFAQLACLITLVAPRTWKGQLPKVVSHRRTHAALGTQETAAMNTALQGTPHFRHHDVLDAVGIGLWALKRSTP